jgi:hypothetical protein
VLAWKIACSWRFVDRTAAKETGRYNRYMNGVFLACGQGRGAPIGLEDQEEEEQEAVDETDNDAQHPNELDRLEVIEGGVFENNLEPANTNLESSEDEKYLIDRQLESDCLEICADHRQAVHHGEKGNLASKCGDTWEDEENGDSPCPIRASSLDTFAKELFEVAEACAPFSRNGTRQRLGRISVAEPNTSRTPWCVEDNCCEQRAENSIYRLE